jgi:hypothetical protein
MSDAVAITRFGGEIPRVSPVLLPDGYAQHCINAKLTSGDLVPYRQGMVVASVPSSVSNPKTIFPMVLSNTFYWNMWQADVDIARSAVANITTQRIYYTGDGVPKTTDINRAAFPTVLAKSGSYSQASGDYEKSIVWSGLSGTATYSLLAAATNGNQFAVVVNNSDSTYNVTIACNGAETVKLDGGSSVNTVNIIPGKIVVLKCNGTSWTATTKTNYPYDSFSLGVPAPVAAPTVAYLSSAQAGAYTVVVGDSGKTIDCSATPWTLTLDLAGNLGASFSVMVRNLGTGVLTISPSGGQLINEAATATLNSGDITLITCNGTSFTGSALTSGYSAWVYTYVTKWGEESAPSPASAIFLRGPNQKMALSALPTTPPAGEYNIVSYRIYRTNTGTSGTIYQLVTSTDVAIGAGSGTYTDSTGNTTLGVVLPSALWLTPPSDLLGMVNMANGMSAAFHNNEVCFCEPYKPHAWPLAYRYSVDSPIVGIASIANSLVIMTQGRPYIASGNHPASVTVYPIDLPYPCVSKRGIVSLGIGIMYPSFEGLVFVSGTSPEIATKDLFTRTEWVNWFPNTVTAKFFDGRYLGTYSRPDGSLASFIFTPASGKIPIYVDCSIVFTAAYSDLSTGFFYFAYGGSIYQWDAATMPYTSLQWWSKDYEFKKPLNFGAAKFEATFASSDIGGLGTSVISYNALLKATPNTAAQTAGGQAANYAALEAIGGFLGDTELGFLEVASDNMMTLSNNVPAVTFIMYTDDVLRFTKTVFDNEVFRLPSGYKTDRVSFLIASNTAVHALLVAETPLALERISGA